MGFRFSYVALEAYRGFRRNSLLTLSMVIIVSVSLTLLGVALLAGRQLDLYGGYWDDRTQVSIYLVDDISEAQRGEVRRKLNEIPVVEGVEFESKEQAYERFQEWFKDSPDFVRNVSPDKLPASYRVSLADDGEFAQVRDSFCSGQVDASGNLTCSPGIRSIVDQQQLVSRFFSVMNLLQTSFLVLAVVLGVAAAVLIAVTVRVAAFARRKETQIMKLVGASNTYIRLPFLAEGVIAGTLGAVVALGFLAAGMYYIRRIRDIAVFQNLPLISWDDLWWTWLMLLGIGVLTSGTTSMIALRKYVRV